MDVTREDPLSLAAAGALVGKHVATLYRWSKAGVRGVVLETLQVGGTRCTTREALQRFSELLTEASGGGRLKGTVGTTGSERAARELETYGV